ARQQGEPKSPVQQQFWAPEQGSRPTAGDAAFVIHLMKTEQSVMDNRCYQSFSERDGRLFSIWWPAINAVTSVN
ncbi:hypothetical protein, partial [Mycobacterium sp.]|uniref:hypothetical protein n=1 Tax=Mycobacterium sp. TaxID=1785 RepID=UPI003C70CCEF